ncbi:hypothetical protein CYME_CML139C [Cyanidioschyzon merolae strain 10D]|uniref:Uncharacterized protein n=1 Tax=Cyanidioschyzon merolae (strain NIES-3377 / 10D) TaxID=280699 RepID=M1USR2_CYAM1|nr:hypothetical protein CYME_CML139C [Cyanidioschyzon merolae strain 10D]BAM80746.1 hypothetical protein CYME_CML139C [Cyanidioschyzon merolae strain 10D]|eukprot:XP_005536782.1 hypothetical protein CYME_CML139C [Cyanidioschyzon merolae strain 10D]
MRTVLFLRGQAVRTWSHASQSRVLNWWNLRMPTDGNPTLTTDACVPERTSPDHTRSCARRFPCFIYA